MTDFPRNGLAPGGGRWGGSGTDLGTGSACHRFFDLRRVQAPRRLWVMGLVRLSFFEGGGGEGFPTLVGPQFQILLVVRITSITREKLLRVGVAASEIDRVQNGREDLNLRAKVGRKLLVVGTARGQVSPRKAEEGLSDLGAADVWLGGGLFAGLVQLYGEGDAVGFEHERLQRERFVEGYKGNLLYDAFFRGGGCIRICRGGGDWGEEGKEGSEE